MKKFFIVFTASVLFVLAFTQVAQPAQEKVEVSKSKRGQACSSQLLDLFGTQSRIRDGLWAS